MRDQGTQADSGKQVRGCAVAAGGVHGKGFPANGKGVKKRGGIDRVFFPVGFIHQGCRFFPCEQLQIGKGLDRNFFWNRLFDSLAADSIIHDGRGIGWERKITLDLQEQQYPAGQSG